MRPWIVVGGTSLDELEGCDPWVCLAVGEKTIDLVPLSQRDFYHKHPEVASVQFHEAQPVSGKPGVFHLSTSGNDVAWYVALSREFVKEFKSLKAAMARRRTKASRAHARRRGGLQDRTPRSPASADDRENAIGASAQSRGRV